MHRTPNTICSIPTFSQRRTNNCPDTTEIITLADTGATDTILRLSDIPKNLPILASKGMHVALPNGSTIQSIASTQFALSPAGPRIDAHIFRDTDLSNSLTAIAPLCAQDCTATFSKHSVKIRDNIGNVIIDAPKTANESLWQLPLPVHPVSQTNLVIRHDLDADYVRFSHACFGSPAVSTFLNAVRRNWLVGYPRLTTKMITENMPNAVATAQGHLDRTRRGMHSTKPKPTVTTPPASTSEPSDDDVPYAEEEYQHIFTKIISASSISHADTTGRFPHISQSGHQYILLSIWCGYIHFELMKDRSKGEYVKAYTATIAFYSKLGKRIDIMRLDNETSHELDTYLRSAVKSVQYVPANNHRANNAERAWRTAKNHIIATLCGADNEFPMKKWDGLMEQIEITTNLLRPFRPDSTISAYHGMHGSPYDFNSHPLAPPGIKVLIYEAPNVRTSWAPHGVLGYYLGPALSHHRTFRVHCAHTNAERISDSLAWFPVAYRMPGSSAAELLLAQIHDLHVTLTALSTSPQMPVDARRPFIEASTTATDALRLLASSFTPNPETPLEQRVPLAPVLLPPVPLAPPLPLPVNQQAPLAPPLPPPAEQRVPLAPAIPGPDEQRVPAAAQRPAQPRAAPPEPPHGSRNSLRIATHKSRIANVQRLRTASHQDAVPQHQRIKRPIKPTMPIPPSLYDRRAYPNPWLAGGRTNLHTSHATNAIQANYSLSTLDPLEWRDPTTAELSLCNSVTGTLLPGERPLNLATDGTPLTFQSALVSADASSWQSAHIDELDRLLGATNTMHAIQPDEQPMDRRKDTTYYNPQIKEKVAPDGTRTFRVRGTAGGDRINYPGDVSSSCADVSVVKTLIQSVVSDDAHWLTADIKDYYLMTPLTRSEYIRIPLKLLPRAIIDKYNLTPFIHNDKVLFEVTQGMYGLPQAGLLAQQRLIAHLAESDYHECPDVPCLFRHSTNSVAFSLVVDDFGIKYKDKADADHLIACIRSLYELKVDWSGSQYLGITIKFDSTARTATLSMPGYIDKIIARFYPNLTRGAPSPAVYIAPHYGSHIQTAVTDDSPALDAAGILRTQQIIGCFLFYARIVDYTMLPATTAISSEQSHATEATAAATDRLAAYAASYPNNELVLTACDMILHMQSDGSHLSRSGARGVAGGIAYFGNIGAPTHVNGAIHVHSCLLDVVVASVAECEYASLYMLARIGEWLRTIARALGYPQPPTVIFCDNACAVGIANDSVKLHRTKSIDVRFHWIRDRVRQGHFLVEWRKGASNLADFFTKPLPVHAHQALMPFLVNTPASSSPNPFHRSRAARGASWKLSKSATSDLVPA